MRIEQLQYLVETARVASINKASERLHITQQSLNAALTKLEDELGVVLLTRSPLGVTLTKEGEKVAAYAQEVLQIIDEMHQSIAGEASSYGSLRGHLELSAGPLLMHGPLPETIKQIKQKYKQVRISLIERENLDMIKALLNNEARLYLMSVMRDSDREFALLDLNRLFYQVLGKARVCAVTSQQHPLARQKSVAAHSLLKYQLAIFQASEKAPNPMLTYLEEAGKVHVAVQTNNVEVFRQYIDSGDVIGFMPQFPNKALSKARSGTVMLTIKDFPETEIVCVADQSYYQKQQQLIDEFLEQLKNMIDGH